MRRYGYRRSRFGFWRPVVNRPDDEYEDYDSPDQFQKALDDFAHQVLWITIRCACQAPRCFLKRTFQALPGPVAHALASL